MLPRCLETSMAAWGSGCSRDTAENETRQKKLCVHKNVRSDDSKSLSEQVKFHKMSMRNAPMAPEVATAVVGTEITRPSWDEIKDLLLPGQQSLHRHDLIVRIFKQKLIRFMDIITKIDVQRNLLLDVFHRIAEKSFTSCLYHNLVR
ncbi:hypothetical protein TNCV_480291 [Trichonephila clavipes]|nr:hypothetical protein TNCV_480291 [Trichonephila clavipes]